MRILLWSLLAALLPGSDGQTCASCLSALQSAEAAAGSNNALYCTAAFAYFTCLEGTSSTDAGCPPTSATYSDINIKMSTRACTATNLCACQRTHISEISSSQSYCTSYKNKLACLSNDLTTSCDGSTLAHTLAATAFTRIGALTSPACTLTTLCTCEKDYAVTDLSGTAASRCTAKKTFIGCIRDTTDAACKAADTIKTLADETGISIATDCGAGFSTSVCQCELTYTKKDISSSTLKCSALKDLVVCLGGKGGEGCASGSTAATVAATIVAAIPGVSGCTTTDTCDCEGEYAKHDISTTTNKCTGQQKFIACLVDKTNTGCTTNTPASLGTTIESDPACTSFTTTSCSCLLAYVKKDISTNVNKCAAKKALVTCLLGKGDGCLSSTTAKSIGTAVIDTDIPALAATPCVLSSNPACTCEQNYVKEDISTPTLHCAALGKFVECLKKETAAGCSGTAVTALGNIAFTNYATLTGTCAVTGKTCGCEVDYIKLPYSSDTDKCTAEKILVSCLKGKTEDSCNSLTPAHTLASDAGGLTGTLTGCAATVTATCTCEKTYAATDIRASNTVKCSAVKTYMNCLKSETAAGCINEDVPTLAGQGETIWKAINPSTDCAITNTCQCEIDYIKATRTSQAEKCTAAKNLIACVNGKTDTTCDGTTASDLGTFAKGIIDANCAAAGAAPTDTCSCEIAFAILDLNTGACTKKKDYMDCLSKAYDAGCDGTTKRSALAASGKLDISSCTPSDVCNCQTTYARVDNTVSGLLCPAIKAHLNCLNAITGMTGTGCATATTLQTMATHLDDKVGSTAGCALSSSCNCQTTFLKATRGTNGDRCSALKGELSCLMVAKDNGCDGTTTRNTIVTSIKTLNADAAYTPCSYSSTCSGCMIPYGEDPYTDATAHCGSIKTLLTCLGGKNVFTDFGCDDTKTIITLATEFETQPIGACTFSSTCSCQLTYMKDPGTTAATRCTNLKTFLHCLDSAYDSTCDGSATRNSIASTVDTAIVDTGPIPLTSNCRSAITTTCGTCQATYAKTDPTAGTHCTNLLNKLGCLAGEKSAACLSSVKANAVAIYTKARVDITSGCPAATTDTCTCEINLAIVDITASNAAHCTALKTELGCLKGKSNTGCAGTSVEALDITAKKAVNTIGTTDCPVTDTCACEITYAITTPLTTLDQKCAARLTELGCLNGKTNAGCDGSSTPAEIDRGIKQWMDTVTTTAGATTAKCTTNPVCLCEIEYAVATRGTNAQKCTALKDFILCLAGKTGTGCDGSSTVQTLAADAHTAIINLGNTDCPVTAACLCEIVFAKADISDSTKECNELRKKMECLYNTETLGCDGTSKRSALATAVKTRMLTSPNPNCPATTNAVCNCMIPYAEVDPSDTTAKCNGLKTLINCFDGLTDAQLAMMSCDTTKTVVQLTTAADDLWTALGNADCATKTDTCTCTVNFLKAGTGALCTAYKTKMDCLVASVGDNCNGVARHTYAGTTETAMDTSCGAAQSAGTICADCSIVFAKAPNSCTALKTYYSCLYGLRTLTSCDGSKSVSALVTEQDTNFGTTLSCAALDDTCRCQFDFLKSTVALCTKLAIVMNCLWAATSAACDGSTKRHTIAIAADSDITSDCRTSLSEVCKCQIAYAKEDASNAGTHCTALKNQFQCLETITGTGCEVSRTLRDVAIGGNAKMAGCARNAACDCQKAYLIADVSGANACPETQKKIACLYATTTTGCDGTTPRTTLMTNTDAVANTCNYTSSCGCQRTYGKATGSNECGYQLSVITCLQDTVDTGCTGEVPFTKTRTELATAVESYATTNSCPAKTDTCDCQIDYAKATVTPTNPDKCKALGELIVCLAGKTNTGCDGTTKPSDLAAAAHTQMQTDGCTISNTCNCQIIYAKIDYSGGGSKCTGLLNQIECVYGTEDEGCDTTSKRSAVAAAIVTELGTASCNAAASDTCKVCIYDYAQVDVENATLKCTGLGNLLHCLDGKTTTSCKSPSPVSVSTLATNAKTLIDAAAGCAVLTDTCTCQYNFITSTASACNAQAERMECLVAAIGKACDDTTVRSAYAATAHTALQGVAGCEASLTATCTSCEIVYAKAASDTPENRCSALKNYFSCLDSQTTTSCFGSKTITTLATEADTRATADNCSLGSTCTCQANYLKSTEAKCTALKNKMSCLAISFDNACDGSTTRDAVATTTSGFITSEPCSGITSVCTCERTYAVEPFSVPSTHCTNLKNAVNCLEGKTVGGCGAAATVATFSTKVLQQITTLGSGTCPLTDTCSCQVTYLTDDISTSALKCTALEKKQACLYLATSDTACQVGTSRKDVITSVDTDIGNTGCSSIPVTCRCQINYGKLTITSDAAKCDAMKALIKCLQTTEDNGCRGTSTQNRTQVAESVETFAGSSDNCTLSDACVCQTNYGKADVTGANKCIAQKTLVKCLGATPTTGCTGTASHTLASTAVGIINGIAGCAPAAGTTCKCQFDHAVADRSNLAAACTATKVLIKCLESSTGTGCLGDSKDTIAGLAESYMNDGTKSCAKTSTCACQIALAKKNIDADADKCSALKAKLVCMRSTNDAACDGTTTKITEATNTESTLVNMGDAACHIEDSCRCEINHAKTDTSTDTCMPAKSLIHCLMNTTEGGCTSTKKNVADRAAAVISGLGAACNLTASCTCQKDFAMTDATTDGTRCTAYKTLAICLGGDNDNGCDNSTSKISLATTAESLAKGIASCSSGLTTTCQCEINYAKTNTDDNPKKCSAYYKQLSCIFSATGASCLDPAKARHQVAATVDAAASDAALSCPAKTDECNCVTAYAKADITGNVSKCNAAKSLLGCMSNKGGRGCDGVQTASSIVSAGETAVQAVVTAGGMCELSDSCLCEVAFGKADPSSATYCTSALTYFSCLYKASATGCAGTSNIDLRTAAKTKISTISGCKLSDTCQCQETYNTNYAANNSLQCKYTKNALGCLSTATKDSCDNTKTKIQITAEFETQQASIATCFLTETCKCQVQFGKADTSTQQSTCTSAQSYNTCLGKIELDQDVGCDDTTMKKDLVKGHLKSVLTSCRGCTLSNLSLMTSLFLVVAAMMIKH